MGRLISTQKRPVTLNTRQQVLVGWALLPVLAVWQLNGFYLPILGRGGALLFWAVDGIQWVVLPAVLLGLLAHKAALRPQHYGLVPPEKNLWPLAWQSLMVFVTAGLVFLVARNLSWRTLGPSPGSFQLAQFSPRGLAGAAVQTYAAVSAGLVESIFFNWAAMALVFECTPTPFRATVHNSRYRPSSRWRTGSTAGTALIAAFFAHCVMCRWFLYWRTLWPVVLGHTLIDMAVFV